LHAAPRAPRATRFSPPVRSAPLCAQSAPLRAQSAPLRAQSRPPLAPRDARAATQRGAPPCGARRSLMGEQTLLCVRGSDVSMADVFMADVFMADVLTFGRAQRAHAIDDSRGAQGRPPRCRTGSTRTCSRPTSPTRWSRSLRCGPSKPLEAARSPHKAARSRSKPPHGCSEPLAGGGTDGLAAGRRRSGCGCTGDGRGRGRGRGGAAARREREPASPLLRVRAPPNRFLQQEKHFPPVLGAGKRCASG